MGPVAITDGALTTGEGCSSISTDNGELQFYTDGRFVFDKNHNQMPAGNGLLGHPSSTQSAIIVPKPWSTTQYYIFTTDSYDNGLESGLCYSRVDMTLNGGLGDVVTSEKNISLLPYACEKVSAVSHSDGVSYWVVTHHWGTNAFYAYIVTSSGVNASPVISHTGPALTGDMQASKGYLKISPDGSKIAMANNTAFSVVICNFDKSTGIVSHLVTDTDYTNPGGGDPGGPYGIEFSPGSQLLYVSEWKTNRKITQYDLSSGLPDVILNSRVIVGTVEQNSDPIGALQLSPDNKIYIARQSSSYISRINQPEIQGTGCGFEDHAFELAGRSSTYGLPSFVQSIFLNIGIFDQEEANESGIVIYPNPAEDFLYFQIEPSTCLFHADINIYDLNGKEVLNFKLNSNKANLDLTKLNPGICLIRIKYNDGIMTRKIVVVHK